MNSIILDIEKSSIDKGLRKEFDVQDVEVNEIESTTLEELEKRDQFNLDRKQLKQGLNQRHLQMIALVNVFGTGIFLSSGGILATSGPAGTFLAYALVSIVVGMNQLCMAECASLMPCSAAVIRHTEFFFDPALAFADGWVHVWSGVLPTEQSAAALVISYWTDLSQGIWITIIIVLTIGFNFLPIRYFGEAEFTFAMIKICLLVILIVTSIVITSGGGPKGSPIGFRYWHEEAFKEYLTTGALGRFAGFMKVLSSVVYSYGGVQSVPSLAAEVKYPRKTTFTACIRVFYRVTILMVLAALSLTLIVSPYNKQIANSTGNAKSSPFVVAMKNAGIKGLPHLVNAAIVTSAFSTGSQTVAVTARSLFALAVKGQAPKIFLKTNKWGTPWVGNILCAILMPLAYMNLSSSSANVFNWFQNISSAKLMFEWCIISANHIFMSRAMKAQGIPRSRLPHTSKLTPISAWISGFFSFLLLLIGGYKNFVHGEFLISSFFSSYFILPLALVLYLGWKFTKKTKVWDPTEVDLESLFRDVEENPEPSTEKLKGWRWITILWS